MFTLVDMHVHLLAGLDDGPRSMDEAVQAMGFASLFSKLLLPTWLMLLLAHACVVLGNLFRDQLDRYGEVDTVAAGWRGVFAGATPAGGLVVNTDDPLLAAIAKGNKEAVEALLKGGANMDVKDKARY